jgi:hypothetical protein
MVVAILNLIFVGHVTLETDEMHGDYYPGTKARIMYSWNCSQTGYANWFYA